MESFTTQPSEMLYSSLEAECGVLAFNTVALCLRLLLNWWSRAPDFFFSPQEVQCSHGSLILSLCN